MRKRRILSRASLLILLLFFSAQKEETSAQEVIAQGHIKVHGIKIQVEPAEQTVPINTPTVVNTILLSSQDAQNEFLRNAVVKGELRGPSITGSLSLSTLPNHPFSVPPLSLKGTYYLEDIRLEREGNILMKAAPDKVLIYVSDVVITEVKVRPLTLDEIREKGIVITEQNFTVYNFSIGFALKSEIVEIEFPVISYPTGQIEIAADYWGGTADLGPQWTGGNFVPFELKLPPEIKIPGAEGAEAGGKILPGVLVFSNDIAFLNQFFSVILIVKNNAPQGSSLALKDLQAKIILPQGLREAETNPPHISGTPVPVKCPGPDGKIGTADDFDVILATFSGMAEFLTEGLEEGTHIVEVEFNGTLSGLPSGDAPVSGKAKGAVLVRNPQFSVTISHPSVVRAGEEYDAYFTVTNVSKTTANLLSLTMPKSKIVGAKLLSEERVEFETLERGESGTAKFHFLSLQTGKVMANYFQAQGAVRGSFVLTMGVGEKGIPLSPDTLVFPSQVNALPQDLVYSAMLVLGEAYSIATTPTAVLPQNLPYVTKKAVNRRAIDLAEAGQRVEYQESVINSVEILSLDWLGNREPFLAFDQLRRLTSKGERFAREIEKIFDDDLKSSSLAEFQQRFAETSSYKNAFFSAALSPQASSPSGYLRITDFYQNRLQGGENRIRNIPSGEIYFLKESGFYPSEFALIGSVDQYGYKVEVIGTDSGEFDLSLIIADTEGNLRQVIFRNVETRNGSISSISVRVEDSSFVLSTDLDGDGKTDSTTSGAIYAIAEPPPRVISATQDVAADPSGHAAALFFNKCVGEASSKELKNYSMEKKSTLCSFLQPSKRVVIVGFNNPLSPFTENKIKVSSLKDESGNSMQPLSSELPVRVTIDTPGGVVYGKVLSSDGKPIPDAELHLHEVEPEDFAAHVTASCLSNSSGDYMFDYVRILQEPFTIEMKDPLTGKTESISSRVSVHGQRLNIDIVVRGRGSIRGKVFKEDGITPAAEASVLAQAHTMGQYERFSAKTNSSGEFLITQVPAGSASLTAVKGEAIGYAVAGIAAAGSEAYVEITIFPVAKAARIKGRVLEYDAATPVKDAIVIFNRVNFQSYQRADESGVFEFERVPAGDFSLTAISPLTWREAGKVSGTVQEGQTFECNIILRGTGKVSGKVLSYDGIPLGGIMVYVPGTASYMETGPDGEFSLSNIPVGHFSVNAVDKNTGKEVSTSGVILTEGQEVRVTLIFPNPVRGGISGSVYQADGTTLVPKARVAVFDKNYKKYGESQSDENGTFTFSNLGANEYILIAQKGVDGGAASTSLLFPGHFVSQNIVFRGTGTIIVNVFASDGKTGVMSDIELHHLVIETEEYNKAGLSMEKQVVTTNANGHTEFKDILVGDFSVLASNPFSPYKAFKSDKISAPGAAVTVDLILKPAGKIEGTVFAPDGITPVPNAKATLKASSLAPMELFSDNNGKFIFSLVPSGGFELIAEDQVYGYKGDVRGTMGIEGQTLEINVRLKGLGEVFGVVREPDGKLVPKAQVSLKSIGFPYDDQKTETNDQGQFRFTKISEGDLTLEARDPISLLGGRAKGTLVGNGTEVEVNIILEESGIIEGTILSPDGRDPISYAQVILNCRGTSLGFYFTAQDGKYRFEHVPKDKFRIEVIHPVSGRKGKTEGEIKYQGHLVKLDILLEGRGTVEGYFYDSSRTRTVPGAEVELTSFGLYPLNIKSNTDGEGKFRFPEIPQARFELRATDPDTGLMGEASESIKYDGQTVFIDIYAQSSGTIKGKVFKSGGIETVPSAQVELKVGDYLKKRTTADLSGEFIFNFVPPGSYSLVASDQANRDKGKAAAVLNFNQEEIEANIILRGLGDVEGTVFDADIPKANVEVRLISQTEFGTESFSTSTGTEGKFKFSSIRVGAFSLEAIDPFTGLGAAADGEIAQNGQTVAQNLTLEPYGTISGRVFKTDGVTPAEKASVKLTGKNTLYASSDNNGYFQFRAVRLGAFTLNIQGFGEAGLARIKGELKTNGEDLSYDPIILDNVRPTTSSVSPPDGSKDVPFALSIVINFSEEMQPESINTFSITLNGSSGAVHGTLSLSADGKTATLVPSLALQSFSLYTILVRRTVEDRAGNQMTSDFSSSFLTIDNIPPRVAGIEPSNGQTQVALSSLATATFSEPINPETVSSSNFQVLKNNSPISGQISFAGSNTKVIFTPAALEANLEYSILIKDVRDIAGNIQQAPFSSSFKTIDTIPPTVTLIPPAAGTKVKEGARIEVRADTGAQTDISKVHFFFNGVLKYTDATAPYIYAFNAPSIQELGSNSLLVEALAVDFAGNQSSRVSLSFTLLPDTTPQLTLTGPSQADVYPRQKVTCQLSASDDMGLVQINFYAQGGNLDYKDTRNLTPPLLNFSSSFTFTIPFDMPPATAINVYAEARDTKGNSVKSSTINLNVPPDTSPPVIHITSPAQGDKFEFGQLINISADASDDIVVLDVKFYVEGEFISVDDTSPYAAQYQAPAFKEDTEIKIKAEATDGAGNIVSDEITVVIKALFDPYAPTVKITCPSEASLFPAGYRMTISAQAQDDKGVARVEFYINDELLSSLTASPYETEYTIPSGSADGEQFTVRATVYDFDDKKGEDDVTVTVISGIVIPAGTVIEDSNKNYDNKSIIIKDGTATINGVHSFNNILILGNGILNHSGSTTIKTNKLELAITGKLVVTCGGKIDVTGKGYLGGYRGDNSSTSGRTLGNTTTGGSETWCGGSYGGYGGTYYATYKSNKIYGSLYDPNDLGSGGYGGSGSSGGNGGGIIRIQAGEIVLDGRIVANGDWVAYTGGSGGSIRIDVGTLSGSGRIEANGADPSANYGAGGGGRIAIYYDDLSDSIKSSITAYGGKSNATEKNGGAGTIYLKEKDKEAELVIDNRATLAGNRTIFPAIEPSRITSLSSNVLGDSSASFMPKSLIGMELIPNLNNPTKTFTIIDNDRTTIFTDPADGDLQSAALIGDTYSGKFVFPGHLKIRNTFSRISRAVELGNLTISDNSTLTHPPSTTTSTSFLAIKASKITIDSTSKIDVIGKGYLGGYRDDNSSTSGRTLGNTTSGGSETWCGGSYGGYGGTFSTSKSNKIYGSLYDPNDLGSGGYGGSGSSGGNGGGIIRIQAGEIVLDGRIVANGDWVAYTGGSGGSIRIDAGTLSGSGRIEANGADSTSSGAAGGGRIAIYYDDLSDSIKSNITAYGGKSNATEKNGGAGTIYLKKKADIEGEILIDNNNKTSNNGTKFYHPVPGKITSLTAYMLEDISASFIPGSLVGVELIPNINRPETFTITANTKTAIYTDPADGDMTQAAATGDEYSFKYTGLVTVNNTRGGEVFYSSVYFSGEVIINNSDVSVDKGLKAKTLTLSNSSSLTHLSSTTTSTSFLAIEAARITVDATSKIDVTGKGYLGGVRGDNSSTSGRTLGNTTTGGSETWCGGSYGGYGGTFSTYKSNKIYGSLYDPNDLGSGGFGGSGNSGGNGGGIIRIQANEIVLDGRIVANGDWVSYTGGSGGSIRIDAGTLSGSGQVEANGADSTSSGAGGGGRIAIYYDDLSQFNRSNITAYGGKSNATQKNGGAGTIYLKEKDEEAELVIDNRAELADNRTILPAIEPSRITSLSSNVLTDSSASFMPKSLIGMELIPNINNPQQTFTIIDNDRTTIFTDPADGDLQNAALIGDTYSGKFVFPGHLKIRNTFSRISRAVELGNLTISDNSTLTHPPSTTTSTSFLAIKASKITIDSTSKIDVIGKGYLGGYRDDNSSTSGRTLGNTTSGGSETWCGGSYGGYGGTFSTSKSNKIYGSLYDPNDLGSGGYGGSGSSGGNGGGIIRIQAGEIVLDGRIVANGDWVAYTGGSGGSIRIDAGTLSGSGRIEANGADPSANYGAGGGGRIAIYYDDLSDSIKSNITAYGGKSNATQKNAGAGTVYLKPSSQGYGDLIIDNRNSLTQGDSTTLPSVGKGNSTALSPFKLTNAGASFIPGALIGIKLNPNTGQANVFTIIANDQTSLSTDPNDGDMTNYSSMGNPYIGEHRLFNLTVKGSARVFTLDRIVYFGTLTIETGSTLTADSISKGE
jgi:hypothetical protein